MQVMVMGVSGSGKTSLGRALAMRLNASFVDGDDLHPQANVDKMRRGEALNDSDREPWLQRICERLIGAASTGESLVIACSALKSSYRRRYRAAAPELKFVYLKADKATFARRLAQRSGHFMPPALLQSQFDALEEPDASEPVICIDATEGFENEVQAALAVLLHAAG